MSYIDFFCQPEVHCIEISRFESLFMEEYGWIPVKYIRFSVWGNIVTFESVRVEGTFFPEETIDITQNDTSKEVQGRELDMRRPECIDVLGFEQLMQKVIDIIIDCMNGNEQEYFVVTPEDIIEQK